MCGVIQCQTTTSLLNLNLNSGYTLWKCKSKADITSISLRTKGNMDYTAMMQSDAEDEDDE